MTFSQHYVTFSPSHVTLMKYSQYYANFNHYQMGGVIVSQTDITARDYQVIVSQYHETAAFKTDKIWTCCFSCFFIGVFFVQNPANYTTNYSYTILIRLYDFI